jgi:hypothetical protein
MLTAAGSGPSWTHSWQRVPGIAEQCRHEPKECLVLQALHGNTVWESLPISSTLMTKLTNARMIIILFWHELDCTCFINYTIRQLGTMMNCFSPICVNQQIHICCSCGHVTYWMYSLYYNIY